MASTVSQPKKCDGRRFEKGGPFTAKGNRVLGREAGHGLPPWKPLGHIHGRKGEKVWAKARLAMESKRKKAFNSKLIQRHHFRLFGGKKSTAVPLAVANIAEHAGCERSREAVLAWIDGNRGTRPTPRVDPNPKDRAPPTREFYDTWEWKEARFAALKRHGRQCQCCGWTPGSSAGNYLVVDHIKPLRLHPQRALDPDNHQVLCNDCNMGKSFKHQDDFRG